MTSDDDERALMNLDSNPWIARRKKINTFQSQ